MRTIALNGSSGFIGSQISSFFKERYNIIKIGREDYLIDPVLLASKLEGADIILNLAGARISLFSSKKKRETIYRSRIDTTRNLVNAIRMMNKQPDIFISMSAVGIYDDEHFHHEDSTYYGEDFLAQLCIEWEEAAKIDQFKGEAVVLRSGIVFARDFGMLKQMLLPFKLGLGAVIGDGSQPLPFIHINDFLRAIDFVIERRLAGIINFVAPKYCTNRELSRTIAFAVNRPLFLKVPGFLLKVLMGEQSSMVLNGQKVFPKRLIDEGFSFNFPDVQLTINDLINKRTF